MSQTKWRKGVHDPDWPYRIVSLFRSPKPITQSQHGMAWRAHCPCHDDRRPSLYLYLGRTGNLIIRCMAGHPQCRLENILAVTGVQMGELFSPENRTEGAYGSAGRRTPAEPKYVEKEVYRYEDEVGKVLYEVVRCEPKNFFQRRADPTAKPGFVYGLGDVRRVLFRLPTLVDPTRSGEPVIVCEGEGKVIAIESLGFLATCNVGGAGMGWRTEYSQFLVGRRVVILPDNDEPGYRHAEAIIGSLVRAGAQSVRCCLLPGLPPKGDIVDFLAAGNGIDQFRKTVLNSPEWMKV